MSRQRNGISLIEMLVVITVLSAAMSIVTLSLYRAMTFSRDVQATVQDELTLSRLARRFREDARQAVSIDGKTARDVKENKDATRTEVQLTLPGQSVVAYRATGSQCERTVIKDGELQHRDVFRCSPRIAFTLDMLGNDEARRLVIHAARDPLQPNSLTIDSPRAPPANHLPWISIEAAVHLSKENKP